MAAAIPVIQVALTAYSAVSAVKALSEGNIMGAVMGGFGAYMGMSNLGAFSQATGGDVLAQSAAQKAGMTQGQMLAEQTAEFGAVGEAATAESLGFLEGAVAEPTLKTMSDYALESARYDIGAGADVGEIGARVDVGAGIQEKGLLGSLGDTISSGWDTVVNAGKGVVDAAGDLVSTEDGSILAKAGEAIDAVGINQIMKGVGMYLDYKGKKDAIKAQEKAAEKQYRRSQQEAQRARSSVGAAPGYVYQFGGRREQA